jgi:F-type H+-transporting ATPase subunit alpha
VAGELRLAYAQFEELETFARFATRLDDETRATIERGRRVREVLKQRESAPLSAIEQLGVLRAVVAGLFDSVPLERIAAAEQAIRGAVLAAHGEFAARIEAGERPAETDWQALVATARAAVAALEGQPPPAVAPAAAEAPAPPAAP